MTDLPVSVGGSRFRIDVTASLPPQVFDLLRDHMRRLLAQEQPDAPCPEKAWSGGVIGWQGITFTRGNLS